MKLRNIIIIASGIIAPYTIRSAEHIIVAGFLQQFETRQQQAVALTSLLAQAHDITDDVVRECESSIATIERDSAYGYVFKRLLRAAYAKINNDLAHDRHTTIRDRNSAFIKANAHLGGKKKFDHLLGTAFYNMNEIMDMLEEEKLRALPLHKGDFKLNPQPTDYNEPCKQDRNNPLDAQACDVLAEIIFLGKGFEQF